jgi:hypothetical protein
LGRLVDLDLDARDDTAWLLSEICSADGEDQIAQDPAGVAARRRGGCSICRPFLWRTDATYLSLAGRGLGLAARMVIRARRLIDEPHIAASSP